MSLQALALEAGLPPRTIRYYISRGLLPGPRVAGRGASYGPEHLERLREIRKEQQQGLTLDAIGRALAGQRQETALAEPTAWHRYEISSDVAVMVRGDAEPWRVNQIRNAIRELAGRLAADDQGG